MTRSIPPAPKRAELPGKRNRSTRGAEEWASFSVGIEVVTPILGGAARTRAIDEVDVIRPATVRGHLRFWWRALNGHRFYAPGKLYAHENELWGRAAGDEGGRSAVELRVEVVHAGTSPGQIDESEVETYGKDETPGAYALWPAKSQKADQKRNKEAVETAFRRRPGTRFRLHVQCPGAQERAVRDAVRAWILFGGYGSRTRRGVGSLSVYEDHAKWLPEEPTRDSLSALFGRDIFAAELARAASDLPLLAGATLYIGARPGNAEAAWLQALDWLREFRQGTEGTEPARAPDPQGGNRPSISYWPEADKIRHLSTPPRDLPWAHGPRHNATPAWPRAGFGLPINGQFQQSSRKQRPAGRRGSKYLRWDELPERCTEPENFELHWRRGGKYQDRLASPLIVKALPTAGKQAFVPCALWLFREYPQGAEVALREKDKQRTGPSGAPFTRLVAPGDEKVCFAPLRGKRSLREAFLTWLETRHKNLIKKVAP